MGVIFTKPQPTWSQQLDVAISYPKACYLEELDPMVVILDRMESPSLPQTETSADKMVQKILSDLEFLNKIGPQKRVVFTDSKLKVSHDIRFNNNLPLLDGRVCAVNLDPFLDPD